MFISEAFAQSAVQGAGVASQAVQNQALPPAMAMNWIPYALIMLVCYFFLYVPHQLKQKDHAKMLSELKAGDKVVTSGGIVGTVVHIEPDHHEATVEIADGVRVKVHKSHIPERLAEKIAAKAAGKKPDKK